MTTATRTTPVRVEMPTDVPGEPSLRDRARHALTRGVSALLEQQRTRRSGYDPRDVGPERPHWCAELEGDSILSSEYLLMKVILEQEHDPEPGAPVGSAPPGRRTLLRIANQLRLSQRPDGTWGQYPGAPADLSACVKAYFALKLFGDAPDAPHMARARARILAMGGAERINTFSMFYLACLGQVSWDACPSIPPEVVFLPRWFPFHLDKVAAWTRTMIMPLAICTANRPVRRLGPGQGIDELFVDPSWAPGSARTRLNQAWERDEPASWKNFFLVVDRLLKRAQRAGLFVTRGAALRAAERWIVDRVRPDTTEGLGAIFPPMVYLQIALRSMGYPRGHALLRRAERDLDAFMIDEPNADPRLDHVRLQPCFSPVWDTGIALYALTEAGLTADHSPEVGEACSWLRDKQVRLTGDWARNLRPEDRGLRLGVDAAAWAFEYRNDWYPDVDDTAMVAKSLWRAGGDENRELARRATRWILAMQNDDGGWAAFDRTRHREWMESVPFADHNAMQDPSCPDITGRTLEAILTCGVPREHPAVRRGVAYVLAHQQPEGCWFGRWGVNYVYGTWQAVGGLAHAGLDVSHPAMRRALGWLRSAQNADGGFGETANSYLDRSLMGTGPSTASQTAWGLATLLHLAGPDDPAVERAVDFLCRTQLERDKPAFGGADRADASVIDPGEDTLARADFAPDLAGSWYEPWFTGTGFPKVFYLRYHHYRRYFPVMALARYVRLSGRG